MGAREAEGFEGGGIPDLNSEGGQAHGARVGGQIAPESGTMALEMAAWSRHELKVMRRLDAPDPPRRRYMTSEDLFQARTVGGLADSSWADRADNQGRRYNALLVAIRQAKPEWSADQVRAEAARQLNLEAPRP